MKESKKANFLYKSIEEQTISVQIQEKDGKIVFEFFCDGGKFGADEALSEYSLTPEKLLQILSGQDNEGWISIYDRLPEEFEEIYGIEMPYENHYACHMEGDDFISSETGDNVNHITHWHPMPKPPKKQGDRE